MTTDTNPTPDGTYAHPYPPGSYGVAYVPPGAEGPYPPPPAHTPQHLAAQARAHAEAHAFAGVEIPEGRTKPPTSALPPSEVLMSLNGFDEIAIAAQFGQRIGDLRHDPITCGRALAFVHYRREGQNDRDAFTASQTLTMREVTEFFAPEAKADDAASAEGNDESA